jgi:PPOX class probable F420-dependent enzyme
MAESIPESHKYLLDAPVATLVTLEPDGRPQQSLVWFLADDRALKISLNTSRQKVANLRRDPRLGVVLADPNDPMVYVEVRGNALIEDDPDYVFATKVGAKYGADLKAFDAPGSTRVVVTIEPTRVRAVDMNQGA